MTDIATDTSREPQRLEALHRFGVMDTPADPRCDNITDLAAQYFDTPVALISLLDDERQWFKSRVGLELSQTPRAVAFCDLAIRQSEVMVVEDALEDPRFADNPLVTGALGIRFYAGAPLRTSDGHALGTLCVLDYKPRRFDLSQGRVLEAMARQVVTVLELHQKNEALSNAMGQIVAQRARLEEVELALRAEQKLCTQVVAGAPVGIALYDGDGDCVVANEAIARHLHRSLESVRAGSIRAEDDPRACDIDKLALRAWRSGERASGVVHSIEPDGDSRWLAVNACKLEDHGVVGLMLTTHDLSDFKRAEQHRQDSEESFRMLFAHSMDGILKTGPDGQVLAANLSACTMLGYTEDGMKARATVQLLDGEDIRVAQFLQQIAECGRARATVAMVRSDGERFEADLSGVQYRNQNGQHICSVVFRDVSERQVWARRLQDSSHLLRSLAQRVPGVIYQYRLYPDGRACFPFASDGIWDIYQVRPEQVRDDAALVFDRIHVKDVERIANSITVSAKTLQRWRQEFRVVLPGQGVRWRQGEAQPELLEDGSVLWYGYISDITDRKQAESSHHQLAYYDVLTGLPNRRLLLERIGGALARAERAGQHGALLFIDLDNFKHINDARGHSVGDALLVQVAARLLEQCRGEDTVSRLGGDEFVVLAGDLGNQAAMGLQGGMGLAERLRIVLECPYQVDDNLYTITGSIGVTVFPDNTQCAEDLLREADTAMYRAKAAGRNRIVQFESTMHAEVEERLALQQDIKVAIEQAQFSLFVQPQFDAAGLESGAELLLRWHHPVRGSVSPGQFIPIAEESGLILQLGDFVIRGACAALARMQRAGRPLTLSVNVSPRQFHQEDFVAQVRSALAQTGASPADLVFEVTENLLIDNWRDTLQRMSELVAMGIRFSIDDFGTGYSSLAYLKKLPLYELKIDQSFVRDTPHDTNDTAIVESILSVARHLQLRVVAEGVETREQADFLIASRCDCLQGYLFARPLALDAWLADWLGGAAA